ncbi:MAG: cyclic nucleotide-binding domain-containing protein [Deltaproteobacteria bacterium]|nr:cyclic nucleotide-binding domain-containing protein [Deltaproteobacteria bacterium]
MDERAIQSTLEGCELFKGLDEASINEISGLCLSQTFRPGELIFQQGDFGEYIYIIENGNVSLERFVDLGQRKGLAIIDLLGKGRALGCWSTLLDEPHHLMASAICQKPTTVVILKGTDLRKMMVQNKDLGFHVMEKLCFLLRERIQAAYGAMEKI